MDPRVKPADDNLHPYLDHPRLTRLTGPRNQTARWFIISCQSRIWPMTDRWMVRQLARQAVMGAALGTILALVLLVSNCQHLLDAVMASPAPLTVSVIFVAGLSIYLAFGATVTGFLLILQEGDFE